MMCGPAPNAGTGEPAGDPKGPMDDFLRDTDPGDESDRSSESSSNRRREYSAEVVIRFSLVSVGGQTGGFRVTSDVDPPVWKCEATPAPGESNDHPWLARRLDVEVPVDLYLHALNAERISQGAQPHGPAWFDAQKRRLGPIVRVPAARYEELKVWLERGPQWS